MRKTYTKPLVFAESFNLLEHISRDCGVENKYPNAFHVTQRDGATCTIEMTEDPGVYLFLSGNNSCNDYSGMEHSPLTCYNGPAGVELAMFYS